MTITNTPKFSHRAKALSFLGIFLLTTNDANSSQTWPPAANPVVVNQTFNVGESATITPGTNVVMPPI